MAYVSWHSSNVGVSQELDLPRWSCEAFLSIAQSARGRSTLNAPISSKVANTLEQRPLMVVFLTPIWSNALFLGAPEIDNQDKLKCPRQSVVGLPMVHPMSRTRKRAWCGGAFPSVRRHARSHHQPKASAGTLDDFPDLLSTEFEEVVSQLTQEHRSKVYSRSRDLEKGRTKRCLGGLSFG